MVVVIDCGMGNLKSVARAVEFLGARVKVTDSVSLIKKARKLILPGQGHFGKAVKELKKRRIFNIIKERIKEGVPFLGICLGMQVLFSRSEEAPGVKGMAIFDGLVKKFSSYRLIVPHMGWNRIKFMPSTRSRSDIFRDLPDGSFFYFAHSYYCIPSDDSVIVTYTDYGRLFCSSLNRGNVWAVQFHPEKSQQVGLQLVSNFLAM